MSATDQPPASATDDGGKFRSVWNAPFIIISSAFILARGAHVVLGPAKDDIAMDLGVSLSEVMATRTTTSLVSAAIVIPAAILVSRLSPGALAWIGILLCSIGLVIAGLSPVLTLFYVGAILGAIGSILLVPLFGQIGRDHLSIRTFIVATTIVVVCGRGVQAVSLTVTDLVYETLGWRILYICWGAAMLPVVFLAWRYIKRTKPAEDASSVKKLLSMLGWLLKRPLVWMCGLSFGLTMSTVGNFGFIWDINLQDALGWDSVDSNLLTFMFVAGVIVGGYFVTLLSKWIGEFPAILINMGVGIILFTISVFVTSSFRDIWVSSPMLFFVGLALGAGTMIQPHISRFFEPHMTAMFFGVSSAIYLVLGGVIIAMPVWALPEEPTWSLVEVRHALFPYAIMIAVGIVVFGLTKWVPKQDVGATEGK